MHAVGMCDTMLTKTCRDCGVTFYAEHQLAKRCKPCQRAHVNAETSRRDKARRKREKAAKQAAAILGLPVFDVVRDNGHKCRACRRVLWVNVGKAPHYCHQCRQYQEAIDIACEVLAQLLAFTLSGGRNCCVCGKAFCLGRPSHARTCSDKCSIEHNRQKARDKYMALTGVCLKPASGERPCRLCNRTITPDVSLGRGRSVCDYCNLHRRTFKSRAIMYGVNYEHVSRAAVFRRDGWRCQLCRRKVLKTAKRQKHTRRLHPRTASLDHIVPMSKGGPHVEANVQCACLRCNVRKNVRLIGQSRLF